MRRTTVTEGPRVTSFSLTSEDELSQGFYESSTDIKEPVIKTGRGRRVMQRRSAEGKTLNLLLLIFFML